MFSKQFLVVFSFLAFINTYAQQNLRRAFQPANVVNKIPYGANEAAGKYIQATDAKIYYEVYGQGQPIVLLHGGLFGSSIEYADIIDKLRPHFQVIAISTRGHGKSYIGTEPLTLEQRANDALTVINSITKDSVILIGFSDGGYSAYKFGAMYPNRVKKMIVIGAGELQPGYREFKLTSQQAIEMDKPYWQQQLKLMPEPDRLQEVFNEVAKCYNMVTVSKDLLGTIKCPVLVMAGDRDDGNPIERVIAAAKYIPNYQISIIPNAGHACHNDNFKAAWASMAPFIHNATGKYHNLTSDNIVPHQVWHNLKEVQGYKALQVIKDSSVKLFDEPTFAKISNINFLNGEIEVKVLSKLLPNAADFARGFIGIAFRINDNNSKFEAIYIRPTNGRAEQQIRRNHSIQYFSYPNYKFDKLREQSPGEYESYADMELNEWITLKIVVIGAQAKLFINNNQPCLIVNDLKHGNLHSGTIGLWVETGTEGYFKDVSITPY